MKPLIVANWKMNPSSLEKAKTLFGFIKKGAAKIKNVDVVVCPPFVYLPFLKGISIGAQDAFFEDHGPFTGEISPSQLKDLNIDYVIVGHSERRKYFNETDQTVNKKINSVLQSGMKAIFCVGENEGEEKQNVIEGQIARGLEKISRTLIKNVIVAYEPVFAIGTGKNCPVDEVISSVLIIKKSIAKLYGRKTADEIKILYGGSVNGKNSGSYLKGAGVDGLLVGGASVNVDEFISILKSCPKTL